LTPRLARRELLRLATAAGAAALGGLTPGRAAAEPPPETRTLRILQFPSGCQGPVHAAEELLRSEGFSDVRYIPSSSTQDNLRMLDTRAVDVSIQFSAPLIMEIERGAEVVTLGGIHAGCFVLFGRDNVRGVRGPEGQDGVRPRVRQRGAALRGKQGRLRRREPREGHHLGDAFRGRRDADVPGRQGGCGHGLSADGPGATSPEDRHVVVDSTTDRPWSQYFCCLMVTHRAFPGRHPVAAKRLVRAIVKANAICAQEPERVARLLVERGVVKQYDYALQILKELPYARWRDYDSTDTLRLYALRLHEAGMVKSTPQKIIAQGSDLRFVDELRKELKS
jgi:NitT/TauT family transport system substrate-binding protein